MYFVSRFNCFGWPNSVVRFVFAILKLKTQGITVVIITREKSSVILYDNQQLNPEKGGGVHQWDKLFFFHGNPLNTCTFDVVFNIYGHTCKSIWVSNQDIPQVLCKMFFSNF